MGTDNPTTIKLILPYPPSINHYWRCVKGKFYISAEGQRFRKVVVGACLDGGIIPLAGRLSVRVEVWPPDRRNRDLDNVLKATLDALQHGGCMTDDSQIKRIEAEMHDFADRLPAGHAEVILSRLPLQQEELFNA